MSNDGYIKSIEIDKTIELHLGIFESCISFGEECRWMNFVVYGPAGFT